jgi:LAGLIDADG DNA endonuclease family
LDVKKINKPELLGPNPNMQSVIVGLLLGDAWLEKTKINARFRFEQSHIRTEFFMDVYKYFVLYCKKEPRLRERFDKRTNKVYKT